MTEGPMGLWKWISQKIGDLKEMVVGQIRNFIIEKVVKAGVTWVIGMLNPAGALIKIIQTLINVVQWLMEKGAALVDLIQTVVGSIHDIAFGGMGGVPAKIEAALAKAVPIVISFLASLLGLGGISEKIRSVIEKVQAPIAKAVDSIVMGAVKGAKKLFGGAKKWIKGKVKSVKEWFTGPEEPESEPAANATDPPDGGARAGDVQGDDHALRRGARGRGDPRWRRDDGLGQKGGLLGKAQARLNKVKKRDPKPEDEIIALERIIEIVRDVQTYSRKGRSDAPTRSGTRPVATDRGRRPVRRSFQPQGHRSRAASPSTTSTSSTPNANMSRRVSTRGPSTGRARRRRSGSRPAMRTASSCGLQRGRGRGARKGDAPDRGRHLAR